MKIGILTFPNSPSFGASLQMYGLYRTLEALGLDPEIINYTNSYMKEKKHFSRIRQNVLKKTVISMLDIPGKLKFREFEQRMHLYPQKILSEKDNLDDLEQRYDFLICGSDQIWNPYVTGEDLNYFLHFCRNNAKRISYAASFGVCELSPSFSLKAKEQLEQFSSISVREEQGKQIISKLLDKDCTVVLDPSMLISQSEWRSLEKKVDKLPTKYIARFIFNYDANVEQQIIELSERTNLPVVTIGGTIFSNLKKGLFTGPIGPREWLYVLDHAEYVVTDSFHGAAFSILFHKSLYVSLASSTNTRLKNLLHTFTLDKCILGEKLPYDEIDYQYVQMLMDEKKACSIGFLERAMGLGD